MTRGLLVKLEISPDIQSRGILHSSSSATVLFSSETVKTGEDGSFASKVEEGRGVFCIFTRNEGELSIPMLLFVKGKR